MIECTLTRVIDIMAAMVVPSILTGHTIGNEYNKNADEQTTQCHVKFIVVRYMTVVEVHEMHGGMHLN